MNIEIRQARESDLDTLLIFEKGIVETERPFGDMLKEGEIHYYDLAELIRSDSAEVLVALVDSEVAGSGYGKIVTAKDYLKFTDYLHLGFMYVKPAFRGRGINKKILDSLIAWAKNRGITEVRLEVYEKNTVAKTAYLKAGFIPNLLEMRMGI